MQMCLLKGKPVYSFDILGDNNTIKYQVERDYRSSSNQGLLKCAECGGPVIFKFRNLDKMVPHFAHLNSGDNESCGYGWETEEHIEGKKILLDRMRELYPNIYHQMRYKVKEVNRFADLFFKLDNQQLVMEFQRTELDFRRFEDKIKDYNTLGLNSLWFLSGSREDFSKIHREYNLPFFQRVNLYSVTKPLLFLNTNERTITMMAKLFYKNPGTNEVTMDKMFYKTYPIDEVIVRLDGTIESDFHESYEIEQLNFIKECQEKIELKRKNAPEWKSANTSTLLKKGRRELKPDQRDIYYKSFKMLIDKLLNNYTEKDFEYIQGACYKNITINEIVNELLEKEFYKGNHEATRILYRINDFVEKMDSE